MTNTTETLPALYTTGTFPELAVYNHAIRMGTVVRELIKNKTSSVVDVGCGEGDLIKKMIEGGIKGPIVGLDCWQERLDRARASFKDQIDFGQVELVEGSMTDLERAVDNPSRFRRNGAVVLLETIEHVPEAEVCEVESGVFDYIRPELVIVTTPDATTRLTEEKLQARGHHFEWDILEFRKWADSIVQNYPYTVAIEQLTGPSFIRNTQVAVFRSQDN